MTTDEVLERLPDREELSRIAGVEITDSALAELAEHLSLYVSRFGGPPPPVWMQQDWVGFNHPRRAERDARRAIVDSIAGVWTDCYGQGRGSYWDAVEGKYTGGLLKLLEVLFKTIEPKPPSLTTLHSDLKFRDTGRERSRGRRTRHQGP